MADNIVQRIIKMVLDKESANKTQDEANAVAKGIDKAWKDLAKNVAGYLGAAFIVDKIVALGKAAVSQASQSQAAWADLKGTIDATGGSFDSMEGKIRATADAFQDATIHDDDAFAESLARVVSLTGDASASLNNMGLVANVAAQFFKGDLAPAGDLVAKAMNGNITALQKMGIHAKDAQDALNILAERSMGAASREAQTFDGQLKQMSNSWDDVLKDLGNAIISSDGATDAFSVLRAGIKTLGDWVSNNRDEIRLWVTNGIKFAIDAADVFIRAVAGMGNILAGGFLSAIGLATVAIGKLMGAWGTLREIEDDIREKLGQDVTKRREATKAIQDNAKALQEWGKERFNAGADRVQSGISTLSNRLFSSEDFTAKGRPKPPPLPGEGNAPQVGANATSESLQAVEKAIKDYNEAAKTAQAMSAALGDKFDANAARLDRDTKLFQVLTANGIDPASKGFDGLGFEIDDLTNRTIPLAKAHKDLALAMKNDLAEGAAGAASSLDVLKKQQSDLGGIINELRKTLDDADPALKEFTDQYAELTAGIEAAEHIQETAKVFHDLGDEIRSGLFMAALDGASALDVLNMKKQALAKAIQALHPKTDQEIRDMKNLQKQYKDTTDAIKEQTLIMQLQAAAADFLADALGTAMQGGLHEAAVQKAKQNAIEAAEMLVRAGAFALFGDFPQAGAALALAGQFAGIAAAWGVLAASTHGSSSGGAGGLAIGSGGGGASAAGAGSDLGSSRSSSSDASSRSEQPSAQVSVYLVGPGFDAINPEVQRVVMGAQQEAAERYGPNARIRVVPRQ